MSTRVLSRRTFVEMAGAAAATPSLLSALRTDSGAAAWPGYERAYVIDMLATAGPFNVPDMLGQPFTDDMVRNARASGITAVNATISAVGDAENGFEETVRNIAAWHHEIETHPDTFMQVRSVADILTAKRTKRMGSIFGFQDTTPYWDKIGRVDMFHRLGVRIVQLTYNGANLVGDGCLVPEDRGLKPYGREVVARLNELGSLVDVSHVGWETTRQAIATSTRPVAATHSGAAAVNNVPRCKPDDILRALADKGGVVGVFMMPFLIAQGQPTAADFMRHLEHCIQICGEDHVGIGSDLSTTPLELTPAFRAMHGGFVKQRRAMGISAPGEDENVFNYVPDFNAPRRMELVADAMQRAGHTTTRIEKILGGNWIRLLGDVWKA
jgi:membrane dipeptidase